MSSKNVWNATLYDNKLNFISNYGKGMVEWLNPKQGESIIDLGCGTGDLTFEISKSGANVVGIDASKEMIASARNKYPNLSFLIDDAKSFQMEKTYDAVFSNAALHWIKQAEKVVDSVSKVLKPGGRFVAEFGGKGNIETVLYGITEVLEEEYQIDATERNQWYFPSIGEYSSLLEDYDFNVQFAQLFERPTLIPDGEKGITYWLDSFADDFFYDFSEREKLHVYEKLKQKLLPSLVKEDKWMIDYKRIRIVAIKKQEQKA